MKITLNKKLISKVKVEELLPFGINESQIHWMDKLEIDITGFNIEKLERMRDILKEFRTNTAEAKKPLQELQTWISIAQNNTEKIQSVESFEAALIQHIDKSPGHRVYVKDYTHEKFLCFLVTSIKFVPASVVMPDHIGMDMICDVFGSRRLTTTAFVHGAIKNKTVSQILAQKEMYIETEELRNHYLQSIETFTPLIKKIGMQHWVNGFCSRAVPDNLYRDGKLLTCNHKVVIDTLREEDSRDYDDNVTTTGQTFWNKAYKKFNDADKPLESTSSKNIQIPIHPLLVIFDLQRHERLTVHAEYLTPYMYDENLSEKLVLSDSSKSLVDILIRYKEGGFQDIVAGKSGGVITLLAGPAGVGKTLTAEVFAESRQKPLYTIHASQLGVEPHDLEKELTICLKRAKRWDAILLIDEADVYVHKRENNLHQNAIVGAFLRVLEYHSSFLFMTTNRSDIIDDAIASRCIAKIDYQYPTPEEQRKIWQILSATSEISIDMEIVEQFIAKYPVTSGRDIKNLLKLANLIGKSTGSDISMDTLESVVRFNPTQLKNNNVET